MFQSTVVGFPLDLLLIAAVFLVAIGCLKGIIGFGEGLLAVPIISILFSPTLALGVLSITLWLGNGQVVFDNGLPRRLLSGFRTHILVAVLGSVLGYVGFTMLPESIVYILLGVYILCYLGSQYVSGDRLTVSSFPRPHLLAGGVGGAINGAFLSGGPLFVSYYRSVDMDKQEFVTSLGFIFGLTIFVRILPLYVGGDFGVEQTLVGLGFFVPLAVGVALGTRLRPYVPTAAFDGFVEVLLVAIAGNLLYDGFSLLA
jgi:uncharacterized membrane protein YfcA